MNRLLWMLFIYVALQVPALAQANTPSLVLESSGNGVYSLKGSDFVDVGGIEIVIGYDNTAFKVNRIDKGPFVSSFFFQKNPNLTLNSIKIAASTLDTSKISGSGVIATISFTPLTVTPGEVLITWSKLAAPAKLGGVAITHTVKNPVIIINGVCGKSNAVIMDSVPTNDLCTSGTVSAVSGSGPWSWTCSGKNGGNSQVCTANKAAKVDGLCGQSDGASFTLAPSSDLCTVGTASVVTGSGPWEWKCIGMNGGKEITCTATLAPKQETEPPSNKTAIDGVCGGSNNSSFVSAPTSGFCTAGTASAVTGSGPWIWTCLGLDGGENTSCTASINTGTPPDNDTAPTGTGTTDTGTTGTGTTGTGTTGTGTTGTGGVSVVSGGYSVGTVTLPKDQVEAAVAERKAESEPLVTDLRKDMTLPLGDSVGKKGSGEGQKAEAEKNEPQQKKSVAYKSTLQLFREWQGERNADGLIPLFAEIAIPDFTQEPPIAFSDGKTPFKITLKLKSSGSEAPKFMLQGANVKQLGSEGEGSVVWTIEVLPKKDAVEATLTVIDGTAVMDFPLTVVPQVNPLLTKSKALSEADFAAYLAKPSRFDLNKDGKFDAVDDYIYTANYIVAMKIKPEKARKEEKKEEPKPVAKDDGKAKKPGSAVKDAKKKPAEKVPLKP